MGIQECRTLPEFGKHSKSFVGMGNGSEAITRITLLLQT